MNLIFATQRQQLKIFINQPAKVYAIFLEPFRRKTNNRAAGWSDLFYRKPARRHSSPQRGYA